MKFKLLSDLHLEFYNQDRLGLKNFPVWEPKPTDENEDTVLLLAGDIHVGEQAWPWIQARCDQFKEVVYIAGNHEFYHHVYEDVINFWQDPEKNCDDFTFLERNWYYNDDKGYRIFGATTWTNVIDPHLIWSGKMRMTDYQVIFKKYQNNVNKLTVQDTNNLHALTIYRLIEGLDKPYDGKTIVMTHHLPHPKCVHPRFEGSQLNAYFMTDLDWILKKYDIDVWCHGHTHDCVDTEVHGTRILCNPMGYHGIALNPDFNEDLIFEC